MAENTQEPNVAEVSGDGPVPAETLEGKLAAVTAERDQLVSEKDDLRDQLLRRQADFENFRRRMERERSDFLQFAAADVLAQLLPILDDFQRALKVETADREYAKGVEMIYAGFFEILKKIGLEPIEAEGRPFDPNLHEAVDRVQTEEVPDQTVLAEYQRGYNFKGKLLRPSMVRVAVRP